MSGSLTAPLYEDLSLSQGHTRGAGAAYFAAVISGLAVAALWLTGRAELLRMAIPAMALVTGAVLYFTRPLLYIQYSLWVWFLAPLIRRIVDWRFGYAEPNFVLVAPLLVSAVAALTLLIPSRRGDTRIPAAFVLCGTAIFYGFIVGMVLHPSGETVYGLFNWLCPMLFGLHLFLSWRQYEAHRSAISKTFLWGVLILGVYGIYQYLSPPAWDRFWLENVMIGGQNESFGQPEPFQVRVWSTMNSPGPFANVMLAGLLVLFTVRSAWKLPATVAGYLSLLLSLVRTTWLSWLIGFFVFLRKSKPRVIARTLALIIVLAACLLPAMNDPRVATVLGDRVKTLSDVGSDESFSARLGMYQILALDVANHPFGYGVSNQKESEDMAIDSGILSLLYSLGWLGALLFAVGVASLLMGNRLAWREGDHFVALSQAFLVALLAQIIGGNIFVGINGIFFWLFSATYLAGSMQDAAWESPAVATG